MADMPRPYVTLDVFTQQRFAGNQLAVVMDGRGLADDAMQAIAREFNYAETSFVLPADDARRTAKVRIFTPGYEMPFAGHPTVGTAIAIARARNIAGDLTLELKAGVFPVRVSSAAGRWRAEFENPNLPAERGAAPSAEAIERALSLPEGALDRGAHRPRRIGAGVDFYYARAPIDIVRKAEINAAAWKKLSFAGVIGVYLYADGGDLEGSDYHVRMFAPDAGVTEDPATGSAAAAFPGQLLLAGALSASRKIRIEQGVELGRPSVLFVDAEVVAGGVTRVAVGGFAVPVMRGELED
jgi:trans-2,3-dihydro-3-hydroxyanthranilate isomerase